MPVHYSGNEFAFIDWVRAQSAGERLLVGPGDDCCVWEVDDASCIAVTTDMLLEGTHFHLAPRDGPGCDKQEAPPPKRLRRSREGGCLPCHGGCGLGPVSAEELGWKAVGVSLSDVAAMGMRPVLCVAGVGLPDRTDRAFMEAMYRGMRSLADRFDVAIAGGDVTSWDAARVVVCTTVVGRDLGRPPVLRSGARPGDVIVVTGTLGGSLRGKHARFVPRIEEAAKLATGYDLHAMIDLSDGLSSDLGHVVQESHVGAVVEAAEVPVSEDARAMAAEDGRPVLAHALDDGEDFELLFTLDEEEAGRLLASPPFQTTLTAIGRIVEGDGMTLIDAQGREHALQPGGYEHLRDA